jgi:hypothetical protein
MVLEAEEKVGVAIVARDHAGSPPR